MRMLSFILFIILASWGLALAVFVHSLPKQETPTTIKTDAIIVLTGGSARVERGFTTLAEGAAPILMISGVGKSVTLQEMLIAHADAATREKIRQQGSSIVLDHVAVTTQTNAREIAQFVRDRKLHSLRIITAHYHMPRSMAEIKTAVPGVEIVPDAVFPSGFQRDQWWKHQTSRSLVLSEFHKYLAVLFRPLVQHFQ
jgi:uncharacterized SAM-binding protein YcdF (DUF218 family)